MHIRRLLLRDVRTYDHLDLELPPGVITLLGSNGQGKTNLVEAIGYLATHTSHRVATDAGLVRIGADRAFIGAEVARDGRGVHLDVEIIPGKSNRIRLNRMPVSRAREGLGIVHTVLFAPEDLSIVKGDPSERRAFLDTLITQLSPRLAGVRTDYDRVLRQRNALLKTVGSAHRSASAAVDATLAVWDEQLIALGAELVHARLALVERLQPEFELCYDEISGGRGPARLSYQSAWTQASTDRTDLQHSLATALESRRREERDRGITLVGPHRDDLALTLDGHPVRGYASHGESWSVALGMRLASFDVLRADAGEDPILILDDVFAELDARRRDCLARRVETVEQVLITAAVEQDVPAAAGAAVYDVVRGQVSRRG